MGSGDLNMKKSWNPLRQPNQEKVWKEEKRVAEEAKRITQLQKELKAERELDELRRLQEETTGRKRVDRVEWMYSAPASGGGGGAGASTAELEDYLLGKKRVDSLLKGDEAKKMARGGQLGDLVANGQTSGSGSGGHFQALQDANDLRDTQTKISNDPLLAIKQQEQAAYQALLKNPQKLKELRARQGLDEPSERRHHHRHHRSERRHSERDRDRDLDSYRERHRSRDDTDGHRRRRYTPEEHSDRSRHYASREDTRRDGRYSTDHPYRDRYEPRGRVRSRSPDGRPYNTLAPDEADRAARLAAMQDMANRHEADRETRLREIRREERAREEEESAARARTQKLATSARFIRDEQRRLVDGTGSVGESVLSRVGRQVSVE